MPENEESSGERPVDDRKPRGESGTGRSFPTNAVVGVIDEPGEALRAAAELREAGFQPDVLSGESGVQRIENAGGSPEGVRVIRAAQSLFGYEAEHTERHMTDLSAGHFVVLVESHDNETTDRILDVFSKHGGHFVNYYSRWTSRTLTP